MGGRAKVEAGDYNEGRERSWLRVTGDSRIGQTVTKSSSLISIFPGQVVESDATVGGGERQGGWGGVGLEELFNSASVPPSLPGGGGGKLLCISLANSFSLPGGKRFFVPSATKLLRSGKKELAFSILSPRHASDLAFDLVVPSTVRVWKLGRQKKFLLSKIRWITVVKISWIAPNRHVLVQIFTVL